MMTLNDDLYVVCVFVEVIFRRYLWLLLVATFVHIFFSGFASACLTHCHCALLQLQISCTQFLNYMFIIYKFPLYLQMMSPITIVLSALTSTVTYTAVNMNKTQKIQ